MSGDNSRKEIGVFIKTSLGSRLGLSVPPDTTAALLIRKVERAHFDCLPSFGEIKVQGFKVKHKSCFYNLSPLIPLVCILRDSKGKGPCFLHAVVIQVNKYGIKPSTTIGHGVDSRDGVCSELEKKCQLIESQVIHCPQVVEACEAVENENFLASGPSGDCNKSLKNSTIVSASCPTLAPEKKSCEDNCPSENSSATRSVTDIIRRHFSATDIVVESQYLPERENEGRRLDICAASPIGLDITPRSSGLFMLQDAGFRRMSIESKRSDFGQRLLMASSKLGISPSNPSPVMSMYYSKARKHPGKDVKLRNPIFELSESSG